MRPILAIPLALSLTVAAWCSDAPAWLHTAAAVETPAYAKDAPAVVLLDDTTLEVDAQGQAVENHRYAIRLLHSSAFGLVQGGVSYNGTSDKVAAADAWILRGAETTTTKGRSDWIDVQLRSPGAAVDEIRELGITLSDKVVTGDVFGFETRLKMPLLVAQLQWSFGNRLPQVTQRFTVTLPPGVALEHWESGAMPVAVGQPKANTWTWTLPAQPYRREEIAMPETSWTNAEVFARIRPSATMRSATFRDFASWPEVARFFQELSTGQCDASPALAGRAKELVAGDPQSPDTVEKIAAYVQKTRYVGINRGLRYGYGWRPRKASEVFASGYGDCKDKANLMVAMLGALGIKSHMTIAYLGRDKEIRPDFPSPAQFNHAIVAIEVPDTVNLPAARDVPGLGRILFFDATNPYTLLGDLSVELQGSYVYVLDPRVNELTQLPELASAEDFRLERRVNLTLQENGAMALEGKVTGNGQAGASLAGKLESASLKRDLEKIVLAELSAGLRSTSVADVKRLPEAEGPPRGFAFVAGVPRYLQQLSATSAVLKLDVLSRGYLPGFTDKQRNLPVELDPVAVHDEVTLHLPAGYVVDEIPARAEVQSPYGSCTVEYTATSDGLKLTRHVVLLRQQVPAADYAAVRKFFSDLARADRGAVMLRKAG